MIVYFSATGNSLATAQRIAEATGDRLVDLGAACKAGKLDIEVEQGEDLGFVWPVYRWSTPSIVDKFVREAVFVTSDGEPFKPAYCWCAITYGYFPGNESAYFTRELKRHQGITVDSYFAVPTPENCIYVSNPPSPEKAARKLAKFEPAVDEVVAAIAAREKGRAPKRNPAGMAMSKVTGTAQKPRRTKQFNALAERCVGCGTCAAACPTNTIAMVDGHPVWSGTACTECLACIHRCPHEASQYGKISLKRNRYLNPILKK